MTGESDGAVRADGGTPGNADAGTGTATGPGTDPGPGSDADPGSEAGTGRSTLERVRAGRPPAAETLRFLRWPLAASAGTFLLGAAVGYGPVGGAVVASGVGSVGGCSADSGAVGYLLNNGVVAVAMAGGAGVLTAPLLGYNGVLLGAVLRAAPAAAGIGPLAAVLCVFTHGIIEIPALVLAGAVGYALPWRAVATLSGRRAELVTPREERHLAQAGALVVSLLAVAAVVEAHVTGAVVAALT